MTNPTETTNVSEDFKLGSKFGMEYGLREGKKEALEDELKFLQSPIKETSKNWVKERITEIKQKLEDLK